MLRARHQAHYHGAAGANPDADAQTPGSTRRSGFSGAAGAFESKPGPLLQQPDLPGAHYKQHCVAMLLQAALDHSLPIKRVEAGMKTLVLWGKILATNGRVRRRRTCRSCMAQVCLTCHVHSTSLSFLCDSLRAPVLAVLLQDYLVAEGYNDALFKDGKILFEAKVRGRSHSPSTSKQLKYPICGILCCYAPLASAVFLQPGWSQVARPFGSGCTNSQQGGENQSSAQWRPLQGKP